MTTEDDFHAKLDADPSDWQTRLVFADWLDERGDPRADGYRALGQCRKHPCGNCGYVFFGWKSERGEIHGFPELTLPDDWYRQLDGYYSQRGWWQPAPTEVGDDRREAEDAAAVAFAKLPADRRAELLQGHAAGAPGGSAGRG